jgi:hypothetical protein
MARQKGILKVEGTLDNLTFYKSQDGHLVKTKGGVSGDRIANDPVFVRTRENGAEFGNSAVAGKLLRDTMRSLMLTASDNRVTARITKMMSDIKNLDTTSARGERSVGVAIAQPEAKAILKSLDFNINAILGSVLFTPYTINTATGAITIADLIPIEDIAYPQGATHVTLSSAFANIDFTTGISDIKYSNEVNLPIDGTSATQTLTPTAVPAGTGTQIYLLEVEFFQEVNGVQYALKNGAYNALRVVEVA